MRNCYAQFYTTLKFMSLLYTFYDLLIRGDVNINEQTVQLISLTLVSYSVESVQSKLLNTVASKIIKLEFTFTSKYNPTVSSVMI